MQGDKNHAQVILALDVGGTFIKSGIFEDGFLHELPQVPSHSDGTSAEIASAFSSVLSAAGKVDAVGIAMPGPFDYRSGISRMTHKFPAIRGMPMQMFFPDIPVRFIHDVNAFLLGVPGGKKGRAGAVTLGTGLGAAFAINGVCQNDESGNPAFPLWSRPFKNGIAEDFISARGLLRQCPGVQDVKTLESLPETKQLWLDFGKDLALIIRRWIEKLQIETVFLGGQIARAYERFSAPLASLPVVWVKDGNPALFGAAALYGIESCQNPIFNRTPRTGDEKCIRMK